MKLEKFKEKDHKKKITIGISIILVLLVAGIIVYRSFAFYEEKKAFDVIKGQVPDQDYDLMFSFYVKDENENMVYQETMPEKRDYIVSIECNNGATGEWDYEDWGPVITNLTNTRTKCKFYFSTSKNLIDVIKSTPIVTEGTGLYEVSHSDANITYTSNATAINNLKQTEYRYAGKNPNNFVTFNSEEAGWRIIGLVNTPEGQRIKLVRNESIGAYSWDTSVSSVNLGCGVNEWSQADLMTLLNNGAYYNRTSGTCYNGQNNATTSCDFNNNGLTSEAKEMIDTITWNTGSQGSAVNTTWTTSNMYNYERSNNTGKICNSGKSVCNDTVARTTTWLGRIGLMYSSDYGYATIGGSTADRNTCLNTTLTSWNSFSDCYENDWFFNRSSMWSLSPFLYSSESRYALHVDPSGKPVANFTHSSLAIRPVLYLKSSVKAVSGDGTVDNPYNLSI